MVLAHYLPRLVRQADHIALTPLDLEEYLASRHFEASVVVLVMGSVSQLLDLTVDGLVIFFKLLDL